MDREGGEARFRLSRSIVLVASLFSIDFDDSIIEDKQAERATDRQDVSMGAMPLYEYRMKWYGEDETTAKAKASSTDEVIE